jgi:hypothetical protein
MGMKKLFLAMAFILGSLTWLNCKITIENNSNPADFHLSLLLKYKDSTDYYYFKLEKDVSKSFDFTKNEKTLEEIKVYKWQEGDPSDDGSKVSIQNWSDRKELMSKKKIKDKGTYLITGDGNGWAEVGGA